MKTTFRMLYFVRETYPTFRPDVDQLFFVELLNRGHAIDFVMQSAVAGQNGGIRPVKSGRVLLGATDLRSGILHKVRRVALKLQHDLRMLARINASDYDFVQFKDKFFTAAIAVLIARRRRIKFLYWLSFPFPELRQDVASHRAFSIAGYCRGWIEEILLYRIILPGCAHAFVQSAQMQLDLESRGVPRAKMTVVPMGVDLAEFEPARARPNSSTATLGYLGKVGPERRLGILIDVLHRLRTDHGVNAELLIVGDGDHPGDLAIVMRRAAELGAQDFVRVTGYLPRAAAIAAIKTADVCISPYYPTPVLLSTSPTKLIEYMALALPVVGNEHPEQSLIIGQSGAGRCVPWGVEPFAAAVADILSLSPEDRAALGRRGRAWVESHRTYRKIADDVEKQYVALREKHGLQRD